VGSEFTLLEAGAGLKAGDHIASAGAFKLYEGIKVFTAERPNRSTTSKSAKSDMPADTVSAREVP